MLFFLNAARWCCTVSKCINEFLLITFVKNFFFKFLYIYLEERGKRVKNINEATILLQSVFTSILTNVFAILLSDIHLHFVINFSFTKAYYMIVCTFILHLVFLSAQGEVTKVPMA